MNEKIFLQVRMKEKHFKIIEDLKKRTELTKSEIVRRVILFFGRKENYITLLKILEET